ncbi:interleukin-12 subunit alpha isoform X2 [Solea solea]|uniref:interleukin-12 subunit alpha isoform X2 n=1 Tax=Solea solea TaxID=90069 RepID=UPI00272A4473|nr:interleukin-12 subunit alpha isoform X2 [Solea solea]
MVKCNLYFTSSCCCSLLLPLLLLQLLTLNCRTTAGLPVNADRCARCNRLFKTLLLNITELLKSEDLCFGILSDKVVLGKAETLMSCTPTLAQNSSCMMQRHSSFSESECLRNIMKDLVYYEAAIKSYLNSTLRSPTEEAALLSPTLGIIKSLKVCVYHVYVSVVEKVWGRIETGWEITFEHNLMTCSLVQRRTAPRCQLKRTNLQRYFSQLLLFESPVYSSLSL